MLTPSLEHRLHSAEYTLLRYQLRLRDAVCLPPFALIRLRRELKRVLKSGLLDPGQGEVFRRLLQPPLPVDPFLQRRVQQPAPAFIITARHFELMRLDPGDLLSLDVCFFGQGILQITAFSQLLQGLGEMGLFANSGRFSLETIENRCSSPVATPLWAGGTFALTPQILDLSQLLLGSAPTSLRLEIVSPARLLKNGRPLFKPEFADIFPFLLRRVTGMCAAWTGLEDLFDIDFLLERAQRVTTRNNRLNWHDWRPLSKHDEVGGLLGSLTLEGQELFDLWPALKIGELLGLGKGAAFGAGRYRLLV